MGDAYPLVGVRRDGAHPSQDLILKCHNVPDQQSATALPTTPVCLDGAMNQGPEHGQLRGSALCCR